MEFEKNAPTTPSDIALADAPKVTLQPVHGEVRAETIAGNYTHENEATFAFETETTAAAAASGAHPHHRIAVIASLAIIVVFGLALLGLYALR